MSETKYETLLKFLPLCMRIVPEHTEHALRILSHCTEVSLNSGYIIQELVARVSSNSGQKASFKLSNTFTSCT